MKKIALAAIGVFAFMLMMQLVARSETCPPGAASCKVLVITPQEEQTLLAAGGIFDSAEWANRANLTGILQLWRQKIQQAPVGEVSQFPAVEKDKK